MKRKPRSGFARSLGQYLSDDSLLLPTPTSVADAARRIAALHAQDGGCTLNLFFGSAAGQDLFAVSLFPERSVRFPGAVVPPEVLENFLLGNLDLLADPRCCVGTWLADGVTYLDISVTLTGRDKAIALGEEYNQIAIYSLADAEIIPTGGTGASEGREKNEAKRLPVLTRAKRE